MTPKNNRPPARTPAGPLPVAFDRATAEADGVNIVALQPAPRRWLRVVFAPGPNPAQAALGAVWFAARLRAADKRLRLTIDRERSAASENELVLVFAPRQGGVLAAEWLEEVKPAARELAAEFTGAELRSVEVIVEG
jgi:hypothetical protein